ncbi:hypothetical protein B0H13DRAFT_2388921 [Mycena leptocephala]|nr:hypothetical protein B0H13DRAFT_2388921 [Mycena leptocephala]
MPPGRPRLNPEVKQQHVEDAWKRYEEKKMASSRALANATLPSKREDIAASDFLTRRKYAVKAAAVSEMYRARKQQEQRAQRRVAEGVKKEARRREREELCKKHRPPVTRPSSKAPAKLSRTVRKPRAASPTMPTPAPHRALAAAAHDDASDQDLDDEGPPFLTKHHPGQTMPRIPRGVPIVMWRIVLDARACARAPAVGFSMTWAFFSYLQVLQRAGLPGLRLRLLAIASSRNIPTPLHGRRQPGPTSIACGRSSAQSTTTTRRHRRRKALCLSRRNPPPPSSPSDLTASTPLRTPSPEVASATTKRTNQERANDLPRTLAEGVKKDLVPHLAGPRPFPVPMTPRRTALHDKFKLSREELDFLTATRPPPVPTSPQRLRQQFVRVLGPEAARPPAAVGPSATHLSLWRPASPPPKKQAPLKLRNKGAVLFQPPDLIACLATTPNDRHSHEQPALRRLARVPVVEPSELLMYAVSGGNRIFQDQNRAMTAFKNKLGSDLVFSRDEEEVFGFLDEDVEGGKSRGKST